MNFRAAESLNISVLSQLTAARESEPARRDFIAFSEIAFGFKIRNRKAARLYTRAKSIPNGPYVNVQRQLVIFESKQQIAVITCAKSHARKACCQPSIDIGSKQRTRVGGKFQRSFFRWRSKTSVRRFGDLDPTERSRFLSTMNVFGGAGQRLATQNEATQRISRLDSKHLPYFGYVLKRSICSARSRCVSSIA